MAIALFLITRHAWRRPSSSSTVSHAIRRRITDAADTASTNNLDVIRPPGQDAQSYVCCAVHALGRSRAWLKLSAQCYHTGWSHGVITGQGHSHGLSSAGAVFRISKWVISCTGVRFVTAPRSFAFVVEHESDLWRRTKDLCGRTGLKRNVKEMCTISCFGQLSA
jgi:hypothetical protein